MFLMGVMVASISKRLLAQQCILLTGEEITFPNPISPAISYISTPKNVSENWWILWNAVGGKMEDMIEKQI